MTKISESKKEIVRIGTCAQIPPIGSYVELPHTRLYIDSEIFYCPLFKDVASTELALCRKCIILWATAPAGSLSQILKQNRK